MLGFGWTACTLLLPGSRSAWPYRVGQPDLDLLDRDYRPELARGGAQIRLIDPGGGDRRLLTRGFNGPGADHFRWVRLATSVT
jgi:TolB protein